MKHEIISITLGWTLLGAACTLSTPVDSESQSLDVATLAPLPVEVDTGIFYGLADPPDPDMAATFEMVFTPDTDVRRVSEYPIAGGRSVVVTSEAPLGVADPPDPDIDFIGSKGNAAIAVLADPPDPDADPPDPDFVGLSVHLLGTSSVRIYDRKGRLLTSAQQ